MAYGKPDCCFNCGQFDHCECDKTETALVARCRRACQILVDAIGSAGPENVEEAALRAADRLAEYGDAVERLTRQNAKWNGLLRSRDQTTDQAISQYVGHPEGWASFCPFCGIKAPRPGQHLTQCPVENP